MERKKYVYWQDDGMWLGYLEKYPDYMAQGETLEELRENLRDIYRYITEAIGEERQVSQEQHLARVLSVKGKYSSVLTSSDEFAQRKREEA